MDALGNICGCIGCVVPVESIHRGSVIGNMETTTLPPSPVTPQAWHIDGQALPTDDTVRTPRNIQIGLRKTDIDESTFPPITAVVSSRLTSNRGSFIYTENLTHLRMVIDTLNPVPRHDNHNFTPQLKHLHLMSRSTHQAATAFTKNNLSSVLVRMAPQLRTLDLRGINACDSTVVHAMMKHVHNLKLVLHWDTLETLIRHHKHTLSPDIATILVIFGNGTPSVFGLVALWKWATSKGDHCLHCVITKWTDDLRIALQTQLGQRTPGNWCCPIAAGKAPFHLSLLVIEMQDKSFDFVVQARALQDAWHLFVDHNTRVLMNQTTLDLYNTTTHVADMINQIRQVRLSTLRIRWTTLESLVDLDENVLAQSISNIHVTFGEPFMFKPIVKKRTAKRESIPHVTFGEPLDTKPRLTTMVVLWKWATSRPGHRLHCVVTDWRTTFVASSQLEHVLTNEGLIGERRHPRDVAPCGLSEFVFEMQDSAFPKLYMAVVLQAWQLFFLDRSVTDVKTNLFDRCTTNRMNE